jgi:hypothetical protein
VQVVSDLAGVVIFDCEAAGGAAGGAGMEPAELGARDRAFLHWQAIIQSGIAELLPHKVQPRRVRADRVLAPRPDKAPGEDSVAGDDSSMSGWSDQSTSGDSVGLRVHFEDAAPRLRRPKELRPPPEEPAQPPPELPGDPAPVLPPHPPPPPPEQPVVGLPAPPGVPGAGVEEHLDVVLAGRGRGRGGGGRGRGLVALDGYPRMPMMAEGPHGRSWLRLSPSGTNAFQDIRANCGRCGGTRTRTCKPDPMGHTARARSAGRVFGHVFAWGLKDCGGDPVVHRGFYPSYDERRAARATSVVDLGDDVSYGRFCAAEREVHAELDDDIGEPFELAAR